MIQSWVRGHQLRERLRPFVEETRAAVKIQAAWRGHRTRKRDPFVREMKREIRCKRTEAHLIHITQTLTDTQRELVKESQLRRRQEESIARLWDEVRHHHCLSFKEKSRLYSRFVHSIAKMTGMLLPLAFNQPGKKRQRSVGRYLLLFLGVGIGQERYIGMSRRECSVILL